MSKYIMTEWKYNIRLSDNTLLALKLQYEPNIVQKFNTKCPFKSQYDLHKSTKWPWQSTIWGLYCTFYKYDMI